MTVGELGWSMQTHPTTFYCETNGTWFMADYDHDGLPDLVYIKTANTPNGCVEIHIASGSSNYQTRILEVATILYNPANMSDCTWLLADYDNDGFIDLIRIQNVGTDSGKVEVTVVAGNFNFQQCSEFKRTTFDCEANGTWLMANYDQDNVLDLVHIKTANTPNGHVEVHVASGSSNYQTRVLEAATVFPNPTNMTDGTWLMKDCHGDAIPDLIFLQTANTTDGAVWALAASGSSNYSTQILNTGLPYTTGAIGTFVMSDYNGDGENEVLLIRTANTPSNVVEIHVPLITPINVLAVGRPMYEGQILLSPSYEFRAQLVNGRFVIYSMTSTNGTITSREYKSLGHEITEAAACYLDFMMRFGVYKVPRQGIWISSDGACIADPVIEIMSDGAKRNQNGDGWVCLSNVGNIFISSDSNDGLTGRKSAPPSTPICGYGGPHYTPPSSDGSSISDYAQALIVGGAPSIEFLITIAEIILA